MSPAPLDRAVDYCNKKGLAIGERLGFGVHGTVFAAENQAKTGRVAVKAHGGETGYRRERDVYLRLQEWGVTAIGACAVPELLAYDDLLWVIEMTVVTRPFVLDFAGAYLDRAPDFSQEVLDDWRTEKEEQFGVRWAKVQTILRFLEGLGIYLVDVRPNNISFGA